MSALVQRLIILKKNRDSLLLEIIKRGARILTWKHSDELQQQEQERESRYY